MPCRVEAETCSTANTTAPVRFIAAFPDGNTGVLTYFIPRNGSTTALGGALNQTSLTSCSGENNQTGLQGDISLSADFSLGVTLSQSGLLQGLVYTHNCSVGSVRTLRDYTEGSGLTHEIFNYTLGPYTDSSVTLVRQWINGTTVQYLTLNATQNAAFTVTPSSNVTLPPDIVVVRPDQNSNATISFTTSFNFTGTTPSTPYIPLDGLGGSSLFLNSTPTNGTQNLATVLGAIQTNGTAVANEVAFLAYSEKFLAGGWRFLTYFGRDTLLTLQLLLPVFSQTSAEAILGAVLERVNTTGEVCHEETMYVSSLYLGVHSREAAGTMPLLSTSTTTSQTSATRPATRTSWSTPTSCYSHRWRTTSCLPRKVKAGLPPSSIVRLAYGTARSSPCCCKMSITFSTSACPLLSTRQRRTLCKSEILLWATGATRAPGWATESTHST